MIRLVSCVGAPRVSGSPVALAVLAIAWQWGHRCVMIVAVLAEIPPRAFGETVRGCRVGSEYFLDYYGGWRDECWDV